MHLVRSGILREECERVACGQKSHVPSVGSSLRNVCFACEPCRSLNAFACLVESSLICLQFLLPPARTHASLPARRIVRALVLSPRARMPSHAGVVQQAGSAARFFFFLRAAVINVSLTREALCVEDPLTHCRANSEPQPFSAD